jgi:hypothetical protein
MTKLTANEIEELFKHVVELGLARDSGKRRPNSSGSMCVVYALTKEGRRTADINTLLGVLADADDD